MSLAESFLAETLNRTNASFGRIYHCLHQLDDEQIWFRPNDRMNSIGNLVLHLCGNLRQWIVCGLGGAEDTRDRAAEFSEREHIPNSELEAKLRTIREEIAATLQVFDPDQLLVVRNIQGFSATAMQAAYGTMTHLEGHTGQILYITRMLKGEDYTSFWEPEAGSRGAAQL